MPKFNLYQSLHTTAIGPSGKAVEIQIRTFEMHNRAEFGIAAHWKYKENKNGEVDNPEVLWLKQLHAWQEETEDAGEFLDTLRYDLKTPEVFVFTPKGSVIALPAGSTPVDFAYTVHTEVGNKCVGAKVNGKLVPLSDIPIRDASGKIVKRPRGKSSSGKGGGTASHGSSPTGGGAHGGGAGGAGGAGWGRTARPSSPRPTRSGPSWGPPRGWRTSAGCCGTLRRPSPS